jgi:hypothetical protein
MSIVIDPTYIFWAFTSAVALVGALLTVLASLVVNGITKRIDSCHAFLMQNIDSNDRRTTEKLTEHGRRIEKLEDGK